MKELSDELKGMLNSMNGITRKLALRNLHDKYYNIEPYVIGLINWLNEGDFRSNGFIKTSNPHKDVIVYELNMAKKFMFKEKKDNRYELIQM